MTRAEMIASLFHATYETLAPDHGYETRVENVARAFGVQL